MARQPLIGYLVWLVLFGALFAWEGLALARVTGVPSLSDVFRVTMRYPFGRWALFALWLWVGWHFFRPGLHFLPRAWDRHCAARVPRAAARGPPDPPHHGPTLSAA